MEEFDAKQVVVDAIDREIQARVLRLCRVNEDLDLLQLPVVGGDVDALMACVPAAKESLGVSEALAATAVAGSELEQHRDEEEAELVQGRDRLMQEIGLLQTERMLIAQRYAEQAISYD
ncbi:hypothetical protein [Ferrimonas marina]|uniref:Uncharacterized protein n=1 Tax=Ferrimonas marina TaxID=299255 RepID=A0A1M5TRU4_9GAMM|nr:hypothetical protein [Ferrimonas marina]SHH53429.1 hypothetical protein SAMN02745129_2252 [Ferrimonas marina]